MAKKRTGALKLVTCDDSREQLESVTLKLVTCDDSREQLAFKLVTCDASGEQLV
jgi:hypothetical protein